MADDKQYPLGETLKALRALRQAAGLAEETFPIPQFVGMISDEIESLRKRGKSDDEIAAIIREHSAIDITGVEIRDNYASPDERGHHGE